MSDPFGPSDDVSTALTDEELEGLIPSYITTRAELNAAEQANILEGRTWAFARKRGDILDEAFLNNLHKRMFGNVWSWAGTHRKSFKMIGNVDAYQIPTELRNLLDNCRYWIEHDTYPPDEIAVRFHFGLTRIHCFPNGNGRHARLATDLLLVELDREPFSWGSANLLEGGKTRDRHIAALHAADNHDIEPLLQFVRS
jgi:Fic-DOC domain mobile mystery protein B